jgi:hypothetical protein
MKYGLDCVNGGVYTCLDLHVPRMMIRAAMLCDDILA